MPIDFQLETHSESLFLGPGLYSTESHSRQAPQSFASIEGNTRGAGREMKSVNDNPNAKDKTIDCKLTFNWRVIL